MRRALAVLLFAGLAACAPRAVVPPTPPPPPAQKLVLVAADFADLPGWAADRHAEMLPAFARSCARLARLP
ncbi:MAG: murein transglycosylase, partial [Azospirillum sp.]|nr:murein transglycosylase [Azospirillum sp.]